MSVVNIKKLVDGMDSLEDITAGIPDIHGYNVFVLMSNIELVTDIDIDSISFEEIDRAEAVGNSIIEKFEHMDTILKIIGELPANKSRVKFF